MNRSKRSFTSSEGAPRYFHTQIGMNVAKLRNWFLMAENAKNSPFQIFHGKGVCSAFEFSSATTVACFGTWQIRSLLIQKTAQQRSSGTITCLLKWTAEMPTMIAPTNLGEVPLSIWMSRVQRLQIARVLAFRHLRSLMYSSGPPKSLLLLWVARSI